MQDNSNQNHTIDYIFLHNYEPDLVNPEEYNIKKYIICQLANVLLFEIFEKADFSPEDYFKDDILHSIENKFQKIYKGNPEDYDAYEYALYEYIEDCYADQDAIYAYIEDKINYLIENEWNWIKEFEEFTLQNKKENLVKMKIQFSLRNIGLFDNLGEDILIDLENIFVDTLNEYLKKAHIITHIVKYYDTSIKQQYMQYYSEIYDLEMELRKVLTYIFNNEYESPYDLLSDYDLKIPKDNQKDEEYFSTNYENEFFMLCFSDYIKICNKQIKGSTSNKDLIEFIKNSVSFKEFKEKLFLGIKNEKHLDFLSSIKEDLNSLEEMRNSIMHSRKYPLDIESYERSKEQSSKKIESFWKDIVS